MSDDIDLRKIVADVAAAYFSNSHVTPSEIPTVINHITSSLASIGGAPAEPAAEVVEQPKLTPAQVRKSITRESLISFEDNKPYKTLRRHLAAKGLTPEEYRSKWNLPADYPMVAPGYSEARSNMAKALGLGSRFSPRTAAAAAQPAPAPEAAPAAAAAAADAPKRTRRAPAKAKAKAPVKSRRST